MNTFSHILERCRALSIEPTSDALHVAIGEQKLRHFRQGQLVREYIISTGRNPPSCIQDSLGTPTGLHVIDEKIGQGAPLGMVFKGRVAQKCYQELSADENAPNLITSRIMWLRGLEPGVNAGPGVDTHARYIYIHGTNHEARLGTPDSHGCVLMSNTDAIELFEAVPSSTLVLIEQ